ncbi:MAG: type II toxin-antitoxin system VapC family toxin [Planctomycetales bacterium]|nr:type II toxin-antitoxin system VapC family toxin [Planctomycetales bacterium]
MIVADASAIVEWLLNGPAAVALAARFTRRGETIHVPHLLDLEAAQAFRRLVRTGEVTETAAREALSDLASRAIVRYPHTDHLPRIWELRANLTAYDAAYVALAETLRAPLVTLDGRLASAPGHRAIIQVVRRP